MFSFETAYQGTPPWDIGRPQKEFVRLAQAGEIRGAVLDVGCGTGENALYLARLGHEVWGIDSAPSAIARAREKAKQRGIVATFRVGDVLDLQRLDRTFDTVIDSGLFHALSDEERAIFARGLAAVVRPGGTYYMLCFSEHEPGSEGPRRVKQDEIRATFTDGWKVNYVRAAQLESNLHPRGIRAWLASITRSD
ncbi:MAG: class I SAM-dependent methyltransferase [Chloroflexi bacterium]|nr:class I SAM-dependent methyltransferase [Chloroflexota bacterium]